MLNERGYNQQRCLNNSMAAKNVLRGDTVCVIQKQYFLTFSPQALVNQTIPLHQR